jgi:hypothetical protein
MCVRFVGRMMMIVSVGYVLDVMRESLPAMYHVNIVTVVKNVVMEKVVSRTMRRLAHEGDYYPGSKAEIGVVY